MVGGHGLARSPRPLDRRLVAALVARGEEVAKGWLVELVARTPLAHTRGSLLEGISAYAAGWVEMVCSALGDDAALDRLAAHGLVPEIDATPTESLRSLDALQAAVWTVGLSELHDPDPRHVAELAERLARVMEALRGVVADSWETGARVSDPADVLDAAPEPRAPRAAQEHVLLAARLRAVSGDPEQSQTRSQPGKPPARGGAPSRRRGRAPAAPSRGRAGSPDPELSLQGSLWVRVLEEEIKEARLAAQRLALILIELEDVERLQASAASQEQEVLLGRFVAMIRPLLRREDIFVLESWGKAWVISPGTGRFAARLVASGVADELADAEPWQGAPLRASAGVALLGEDGEDAGELIEAAEEQRFAAASRGLVLVEPETS